MIPIATLAIEAHALNPPNPTGLSILVDGAPIAVVALENLDAIYARLSDMRQARAPYPLRGPPTSVYLFRNGMVMAFGSDGKQLPDFQGHYTEVMPALLASTFHGALVIKDWR